MFTGLTASQYATKNKHKADEERPWFLAPAQCPRCGGSGTQDLPMLGTSDTCTLCWGAGTVPGANRPRRIVDAEGFGVDWSKDFDPKRLVVPA